MIYEINHQERLVAIVVIDDSATSHAAIKEMVEFWAWWQEALKKDGGDYTRCWLRKLAHYMLINGKPPHDEEGWYPLDGSRGIKVVCSCPWEFDPEDTTIVAKGRSS